MYVLRKLRRFVDEDASVLSLSIMRNASAVNSAVRKVPREIVSQSGRKFIVELQSLSEKPELHLPKSRFLFRQSDSSNRTILTMMNQQSSHQRPLSPIRGSCNLFLLGPLQIPRNHNPSEGICLAVDVVGIWT